MRDEEARTIISRDSYVGDATALLKIDPLVSSSECASLKRETLLVGVGSSVLWFDPFFAVVDDDDAAGTAGAAGAADADVRMRRAAAADAGPCGT